ncbi:polyprenyl synthetase family protein [Porticoccus sp. W117]|uniref:polyprenyl synthetase family protein n=1 Tax=Porticoccus sp. W117 TaxID=3054777 RepID=UPI0025959006|nr:polyprenyl synthetase family protein [Porticoccus sp. W117]MDM3872401.1 polyprenyl synthetase family protein [Porticoccus sp. W117]
MLPFHRAVESDFLAVNDLIINQLHSDVGLVENIGQYIVDAGGKRLRPLLVLLAANACGYQGKRHVELAAIIEFIHTATLLHDDVVDTSDMRRGRATANARWGNAPSVLVGDFLYSRAFQMLVAIGDMEIMSILADTTNLISEGEVQQLINAGNPDISEADYFEVIRKKTAQLFEAAAQAGAVLATENSQQREAMKLYGRHLGLAFQLVDDALDYQGNAEELGKNVGDDLAEGKPTLPLLAAMRLGNDQQAATIREAIKEAQLDKLEQVVEIVKQTGALDYTMEKAQQQVDTAKQQLSQLPDSPLLKTLEELVNFSIARTY